MCGILCEICFENAQNRISSNHEVLQRIRNRGPNCMKTVEIKLSTGTTITFCGAVLWMQGLQLTPQPVEDENGILLYNGDIFDESWTSELSDTQIIMDKLSQRPSYSTEEHMLNTLKLLKGPYCLIYYDKHAQNLYFARDKIGRSTMLFSMNEHSIVIASVLGKNYDCIEVPATFMYCLNIFNRTIKLFPWTDGDHYEEYDLETWLKTLKMRQSLSDNEFSFDFDENVDLTDNDDIISFIQSLAKDIKCKKKILEALINNLTLNKVVIKVTKLLENSVKIRLKKQPNICKDCLEVDSPKCDHCTIGVLFSGGLDCTILALLADKYLPRDQSIDLINVAFRKDDNSTYNVPDRLTGRQSYEELKKISPYRKWVFREVNVPKEDLQSSQITPIADLVYPRQTILDESLGSALWFAARGKDTRSISPCRVLLVGSGADELFGGYTRHRNAYKWRGWTGLVRELQLDWKRISFRNLSRDNRVICDHGRQPRMPYLDEEFTEYVLQLKPWFKCVPSENLGPGVGDKLMLRLVAYNLGLSEAAILPKRALQFGSRIANSKERGSDVSERFLKLI